MNLVHSLFEITLLENKSYGLYLYLYKCIRMKGALFALLLGCIWSTLLVDYYVE